MGLDIFAALDNRKELGKAPEFKEIQKNNSLSRTFCNFMSRRNVVEDCRPELEQLEALTGVNTAFFYEMEEYLDEYGLAEMLEFMDPETAKLQGQHAIETNKKIEGNVHRVKKELSSLIDALGKIPNLESKMEKTSYDTIGISTYFADFHQNPGDGYIGNNLGQDLRNLFRLVDYGSRNGATTVYFNYG